jgi:hypothetical protein
MRTHGRKVIVLSVLAILLALAGWLSYEQRPARTNVVSAEPAHLNAQPTAEQRQIATEAPYRLPMNFELNIGQSTPEVKFQARGRGYGLFLGEGAAFLMLKNHNVKTTAPANSTDDSIRKHDDGTTSFLKLTFCNANEKANIHGINEVITKTHYYKGADESKWVTNVPNYSKVCYDDLYPGIDMVYYGTQSGLEYDYIVKPGADASAIAMEIGNAKKLELTDKGDLIIKMENGQIHKGKPIVYQEVNGQRKTIEGSYVLEAANRIAFKVGAYDRTQTLVIDPSIVWSSYMGDSPSQIQPNNFGQDKGYGVAVDAAGNVYATGSTDSYDFPHPTTITQATLNRFSDPSVSGTITDAYIQEFSPDGKLLKFSAFFGGNSSDGGRAVAVDSSGFIYFTGFAGDGTFPIKNARFTYTAGTDAFVAKVAPTGASLVFSTLIGGSGDDVGLGIAADANGNSYVTGGTKSANFPIKFALVSAFSGVPNTSFAGFLAKFSPDGSNVVFSTYIDGPGAQPITIANAVAVDASANIYVGGTTDGLNPVLTQNAFQSGSKASAGNTNGFVLKVDTNAAVTIFGTYLGDTGPDGVTGVGVDNISRVFVTGFTQSANFPTQSPNQGALGAPGAQNAFFTIFANTGQSLAYSTFLGGSGVDSATGMAVDPDGYAYIVGTTTSTDFPVALLAQPPIQAGNAGGSDAFIAKYNPTGGEIYATYLGSSGNDQGHGIAAGVKGSAFEGNAYITGEVGNRDGSFGTSGAVQELPGATNPSFFVTIIVAGTANPGSTDITGVSNASIANLAIGDTLKFDAGGFVAGQTIAGLAANTITMSGPSNVAVATSATFIFQSNTATFAPDAFVTHIGDLSPRITSPTTLIAAINQPIPAYTITASNNPTSFGAAGLASIPLAISGANNNIINGTPLNPGVFQVLLTATNAAGTGTAFLNVVVNGSAPAITSPSSANISQGQGFTYNITATQNPTIFGASNLPPGLTIDTLTGNISGTPTNAGSFLVPITATNNVGTGNATLTINISPQPPIIVGSLAASGSANAPFSYTISALNNPTSFTAAPLPPGLSLNTSTGQISGTPTVAGVTNVVLSATNAGGTSVVMPTLVITIDNKPVINSSLSVSTTVNTPFTYTITALNAPTSFTAVGLPPGLSLAGPTISGMATVPGVFIITLGATNATGTGQAILTLNVSPGPPVVTSSPTAKFSVNAPFIYTITATNTPTAFTATNLPAGLTLDPTTGVISGSVSTIGVFTITVGASNSAGASAPLTVTITILASPPLITSPLLASGFVANGFTYTITALGSAPQTYTASPLPPGLTFNGTVISGVPTQEGTYAVTVTATNSLGTDTKVLIISISSVVTSIKEIDVDGDGFPDELELGVGTNPTDPKSTPFGGAPAGSKHVANITSMQIKLDFSSATSTKDAISIKGTIPVPPTFKGPPKNVVVFVGGIVRQFAALTPVSPAGPKDSFKLKVTKSEDPSGLPFAKTPTPVSNNAVTANFQLRLGSANFKSLLFDEGLIGTAQIKEPAARTVDVIILLEDIQGYYQSAKVLQYTVHGKTGMAKNGK